MTVGYLLDLLIINEVRKEKLATELNNDVKIESSEVDKTSDEKSIGFATSITVKEEKQKGYNITNLEREGTMTREEYRKTHTRPNGKPYNNKKE